METLSFDLILLIISKADLETRIQCRRVCKSWLAALSNPAILRSIPWPKCLLLHSFLTNSESRSIYLYSTRKVPSRDNAILKLRTQLKPSARDGTITIVGSCNGLVCEYHQERLGDAYYSVSNPLSTGSVTVAPEGTYDKLVGYGFGLSRDTKEYKLVLLVSKYDQLEAMVVTIGIENPTWRRMSCSRSFRYRRGSKMGKFVNGALHWSGDRSDQIWVFDVENEQFSILQFPPNLFLDGAHFDHIVGVVKNCLTIVMLRKYENDRACGWEIWALKDYNVKYSWVLVRQFKSYHLPAYGYGSWSESPWAYVLYFEPLMLYKSGSNKERTLCMRRRYGRDATMYVSDPKDNTFSLINMPFADFEVLIDYVPTFLSVHQLLSQR